MYIIQEEVNHYALLHSTQQDSLLNEIQKKTEESHSEAHMLSGPLQGEFLSMVSRMIKPKMILEIGSFVGYSALCLVKGLAENGELHTIEKRENDALTAQSYFDQSEYKNQLKLHVGSATDIIADLNKDWDLIFIDADKTGYLGYYKSLIETVKAGTWFLFDNVFFHGEVIKKPLVGKNAKAIHEFNEYIKNDSRVEKVILTIRDGLTLLYKK